LAKKKVHGDAQILLGIKEECDQEQEKQELASDSQEDVCYIEIFMPGFRSGWRSQFDLDARGFLVAKKTVDYRRKGAK
jgi:hypothetical protein